MATWTPPGGVCGDKAEAKVTLGFFAGSRDTNGVINGNWSSQDRSLL